MKGSCCKKKERDCLEWSGEVCVKWGEEHCVEGTPYTPQNSCAPGPGGGGGGGGGDPDPGGGGGGACKQDGSNPWCTGSCGGGGKCTWTGSGCTCMGGGGGGGEKCGNGKCKENKGENCKTCPKDCGTCKATVQGIIFDVDAGGTCSNPYGKSGFREGGTPETAGISGVSVSVERISSGKTYSCATSRTVTTDNDGRYSARMCVGTYRVEVVSGAGYALPPALYCDSATAVINKKDSVAQLNFGLSGQRDAWFQVEGTGNVYVGGTFRNKIPPSCTPDKGCTPQFILTSGSEDPGIAIYGGWTFDLGEGTVSKTNWHVNSPYDGKQYGYKIYWNQLGFATKSPADYEGVMMWNVAKPASPPLSGTAYLARKSKAVSNMTITQPWNVSSGEQIVFLVDGDLDIQAEVQVAEGGFLGFFVTGDINIGPVINSEDNQAAIEGMFVADGTINTGIAETKLILEGTYVGWTAVNLQRDLGARNNTGPAELFIYRPDFMASAPDFLRVLRIEWEEVAP